LFQKTPKFLTQTIIPIKLTYRQTAGNQAKKWRDSHIRKIARPKRANTDLA